MNHQSMETTPYHSCSAQDILQGLETTASGLTDEEASRRLAIYGKNELIHNKKKSLWRMIWEQIKDPMIIILMLAAILSFVLKEWAEGGVIFFIVFLNAFISIIQEKKAAASLEALRKLGSPNAHVFRNEEESMIPAATLVVGDIVVLEDGCLVPADLRLIETFNLKIQESSLTGESLSADKESDMLCEAHCPLGDRSNMAYSSSMVTYGRGIGVVVATGMNTEVGHIAHLLQTQDEFDTPLKRKLTAVGKILSIVGLIICVIIFGIGLIYQRPMLPLLMTAISLAISVIPEGLPATATIVMALGVQRMAKRHALIRKLPAVETLGSASIICCDKTGTLTQNKMTVTHIAVNGDFETLKSTKIKEASKQHPEVYQQLIYAGALCNNACFHPDIKAEIIGDPTEGALLYLAKDFGIDQSELEETYPRVFEQAFDSDRKRMTTVHVIQDHITAYTKGAVDELLELCTHILTSKGERAITELDKANIRQVCLQMGKEALRVLGYARRYLVAIPTEDEINIEDYLTFIGVTGMIDPPRLEVLDAVQTCHKAGIRVIMITGDHKVTATAIAKQLGILEANNLVVSVDELEAMNDAELDLAVKRATVFARVSPKDKLRIVESLKRNQEIVAMTGDGVNDSPALKQADIGIAMGISGTDVAKDASDMILMDDNFTTIEYAIREGRRIYRNIQKVIQFLLAGNIAEILTLFIATLLNWEAPILAVHILLINLATDTLPALALGVDPSDKNIMNEQPVKTGSLFEKSLIQRVMLHGIFITVVTIAAYQIGFHMDSHLVGQTMAFLVLAISQMLHAFNQRSNIHSIFTKSNGHNKSLWFALLASALILILLLVVPQLRSIFSLTVLNWEEWLIIMGLSIIPVFCVEVVKLITRIIRKKQKL